MGLCLYLLFMCFFEFSPVFYNILSVVVIFFSRTDNYFQFLSCSFSVRLEERFSRMSSLLYLNGSCVPTMHIQSQLLSWGKEFLTHLDNMTSPYSFFLGHIIYSDHVFPSTSFSKLLPTTSLSSQLNILAQKLKMETNTPSALSKMKIKTNKPQTRKIKTVPKWIHKTNKIHRLFFVLTDCSWAWGLPLNVVDVLHETPLVKTYFSFESG